MNPPIIETADLVTAEVEMMDATDGEVVAAVPTTGADDPETTLRDRAIGAGRLVLALVAATALFGALLLAKGADPIDAFRAMWESAFGDADSFGETLLRTAPLLLGALAVVLPASAGLFNIGGQGQMLLGGVGAMAAAHLLGDGGATAPTLVVMAGAAAIAGALWAAIPAALKAFTRANETITSLLMNYLAIILLNWIVFEPWKDPASLGQAYSEELTGPQRLPILWGSRVNVGILIAPIAAVVVFVALRHSRWGFRLRVLGGNPDAAHRAGFSVTALWASALCAGGALAGLAGFVEIAGIEGRLRPDVMPGYGYVAFLAAWLARHDPFRAIGAAVVLAAIAVGGNGLKISAGLSGAAVNILMALVLLAVLGWGRKARA